MLPHLLHGVRAMVYSVTLARTDILPEDGHTVTETCRRFYKILANNVWICFIILSLKTKDTSASSWLFDFISYFLARYKNENREIKSFQTKWQQASPALNMFLIVSYMPPWFRNFFPKYVHCAKILNNFSISIITTFHSALFNETQIYA